MFQIHEYSWKNVRSQNFEPLYWIFPENKGVLLSDDKIEIEIMPQGKKSRLNLPEF